MRKVRELLCKVFGHRWNYYHMIPQCRDVRVCSCCHELQSWSDHPSYGFTQINEPKMWIKHVQYRPYGAKIHVEGYGK